jgi:excinuclease UvrABC nuclease subunit
MVQYKLVFDGYWVNADSIPDGSGIYCVYTCLDNTRPGMLGINDLIYVGESQRVRDRIQNHELRQEWKNSLEDKQDLCYSFAPISTAKDRLRAEAAIIFVHKPRLNKEHKNKFPFQQTDITISGRHSKLEKLISAG